MAAEYIWSLYIGCLKGMTVWLGTIYVQPQRHVILVEITERYHNRTLTSDIMWVNGIRFILTILIHIIFITGHNFNTTTSK